NVTLTYRRCLPDLRRVLAYRHAARVGYFSTLLFPLVRVPEEVHAMKRFVFAVVAACAALATSALQAQTFPTRPIRIVTSSPGSGSDFSARIVAQGLTERLGQPVIVDNRFGVMGVETASKAQGDGYTLYLDGSSFWLTPLLKKTPYDVMRDFS